MELLFGGLGAKWDPGPKDFENENNTKGNSVYNLSCEFYSYPFYVGLGVPGGVLIVVAKMSQKGKR